MILRELKNGSFILITQEDHADLSAQFAAHWGNKKFTKLQPYKSMVFGAAYHDSGYGEWEGCPPINLAKSRPYGHREDPPGFEQVELGAYVQNIRWVQGHDPYSGLIVSMHRTGLWQNRYQTLGSIRPTRERSSEIQAIIKELESLQQKEKKSLGGGEPKFEEELWFNYRLLQVFDVLSLYFCCNGYEEERLKEDTITPVPVAYGSKEEVDLHIVPTESNSVKIEPFPLDLFPLKVSVRARTMPGITYVSEEECREAYYKASRYNLTFELGP